MMFCCYSQAPCIHWNRFHFTHSGYRSTRRGQVIVQKQNTIRSLYCTGYNTLKEAYYTYTLTTHNNTHSCIIFNYIVCICVCSVYLLSSLFFYTYLCIKYIHSRMLNNGTIKKLCYVW